MDASDFVLSCFCNENVYWCSCSFQDRVWANVGKSLNCIIAMVDKLIESDGGSEDSGGSRDGEQDLSVMDSIQTHPRGKESFFSNHWLSKQNEKVMIKGCRKRRVNSDFDESADSTLFHLSDLDDGRLFIELHLSCVFRTACNAHFFFCITTLSKKNSVFF